MVPFIYREKLTLTWLAKKGFDPDFGARPLKRLIMHEIGDKAALMGANPLPLVSTEALSR